MNSGRLMQGNVKINLITPARLNGARERAHKVMDFCSGKPWHLLPQDNLNRIILIFFFTFIEQLAAKFLTEINSFQLNCGYHYIHLVHCTFQTFYNTGFTENRGRKLKNDLNVISVSYHPILCKPCVPECKLLHKRALVCTT